MLETGSSAEYTAELIVFLRTSEEAQSDVDTTFELVTPAEVLTQL